MSSKIIFVFVGVLFGLSGCAFENNTSHSERGLCLRNAIQNTKIKDKLHVCGQEQQNSDGCIFYILNHKRYDVLAEDLFEEVANKTSRQYFHIQIANPVYAKQLIPPGYLAQIIVPPLK